MLDLGFYFVTIKLEDNFATANIQNYVECQDREYTSETLKNQCKERENGVTYYDIAFQLVKEEDIVGYNISPDAALVVDTYQGRVYDLGDSTLEDIYSQAATDYEQAE